MIKEYSPCLPPIFFTRTTLLDKLIIISQRGKMEWVDTATAITSFIVTIIKCVIITS